MGKPMSEKPPRQPGKEGKFFRDLDMEMITDLVQQGITDREIRSILGVSFTNWYGWLRKYPEFKLLVTGWHRFANARVERALYERAVGYKYEETRRTKDAKGRVKERVVRKSLPPSEQAMKFWLLNRGKGWVEKQEVDTSVKGGLIVRWEDSEGSQEPSLREELPDWLK